MARVLNRDLLEVDAPAWQTGVRIVYVPVAADERLPKVISGAIDLECGSTTANAERAKTVAFSPIFFLAGANTTLAELVTGLRRAEPVAAVRTAAQPYASDLSDDEMTDGG